MSLLELERAATAPSRWIMLSSSKDRNPNKLLSSRTTVTRITNNSIPFTSDSADLVFQHLYLVPGGRYLVASSRIRDCIGVWDLGYVFDGAMSSAEKTTTVWVTRINKPYGFTVCPTPDGLGIRILTYSYVNDLVYNSFHCLMLSLRNHNSVYTVSFFEIYPQKDTYEHAKIGELTLYDRGRYGKPLFCGNRAIIYFPTTAAVIVWDFMANTNWSFRMPRVDDWVTVCFFFLPLLQ